MVSLKFLSVALAALTAADAAKILSVENTQDVIKDSYIVVMKDEVPASELNAHVSWVRNHHHTRKARRDPSITGVRSTFSFGTFKGYLGAFDHETLDEILKNPKV